MTIVRLCRAWVWVRILVRGHHHHETWRLFLRTEIFSNDLKLFYIRWRPFFCRSRRFCFWNKKKWKCLKKTGGSSSGWALGYGLWGLGFEPPLRAQLISSSSFYRYFSSSYVYPCTGLSQGCISLRREKTKRVTKWTTVPLVLRVEIKQNQNQNQNLKIPLFSHPGLSN